MTYRQILKKLGMWDKSQRETYKALANMTDRELSDIGLERGNITDMINDETDK